MKKSTFLFFALYFICVLGMAFSHKLTNIRSVQTTKIDGIECFVLCEPTEKYSIVVDSKKAGLKTKSLISSGLINNTINDEISQFVKRIKKEAEKENLQLDAIIYTSGKTAIGIKFD